MRRARDLEPGPRSSGREGIKGRLDGIALLWPGSHGRTQLLASRLASAMFASTMRASEDPGGTIASSCFQVRSASA